MKILKKYSLEDYFCQVSFTYLFQAPQAALSIATREFTI